jgi:hypothetical protein
VNYQGRVPDFDQFFYARSFHSRYCKERQRPGHMKNWIKTCRELAASLAARLIPTTAGVALTFILLGSTALPQSHPEKLDMSAGELAQRVVNNELKFQDEDHSRWMYRLEKEESGRQRVQEILETNDGSLSRLLSVDSHPLDAKQQQEENQRMQRLVSHPDELRKLQQASNKEAERGERLFKILPEVLVFAYAGRQGNLVTLTFQPNPSFQPVSLEARVLHGMQGQMTVDTKQDRLVTLNGHLMEDMKFGGGLLGRLDKGGEFEFKQTEVAPGHWEMIALRVDMKGKALLFKTIDVQETENHSDFRRIPADLTLAEATDILNTQMFVADRR